MKIGLRGGHSPNCKGAFGILDEQVEVRKIYNALVPLLQASGHTVVDCNSNAYNVGAELSEGTNKANSNNCDMFISIHMNASSGAGNGTECWLYNGSNGRMNDIASKICSNFASKGFQNRGVKYNTGYHDLNASAMPAMIIETLFCDNRHDADLYYALGVNGIASLIADAINGKASTGSAPVVPQKPSKPVAPSKPSTPAPSKQKLVFTYAVKAGGRILPEVQNLNDWAGMGDGVAITDIAIKCNFGSLKYRVHVLGGGWLPWVTGYNWNDSNNGYAGIGKPIDAIEIYYTTPADYAAKYGYQKAQYRVSPVVSDGYYSWQFDNERGNGMDGYAGCFGLAIDKFQLC